MKDITNDLIELMKAHKGYEHSISVKSLTDHFGITGPELREAFSELVKSEKALLGSHPEHGMFMIESKEDFETGIRHIKSRRIALTERERAMERMWEMKQVVPIDEVSKHFKDAREALKGEAHVAI